MQTLHSANIKIPHAYNVMTSKTKHKENQEISCSVTQILKFKIEHMPTKQ